MINWSQDKVFTIAEIGGNHEGSFEKALELLNLAKETGFDAIKFQIYSSKNLVNAYLDADRSKHFKKFELKKEEYIEDYFLQIGAYSLAHNAVHNSKITQGVILVCTVDRLFQDFKIEGNELKNYQNKFLEKVEQFYQITRR